MTNCLDDIVRSEDNFLDTRFMSANISRFAAFLVRDRELHVNSHRKLVGLSRNTLEEALRIINIGNVYDFYGEGDNAFYCYSRAVRILERSNIRDFNIPSHVEVTNLFKFIYNFLKIKFLEKFGSEKLRESDYVKLVVSEILLDRDDTAHVKDFIKFCNLDLRRKYILARLYTSLVDTKKGREEQLSILSYVLETDIEIESISAGKSEVIVFADSVFGREVVAKLGKLDELKREMQATQEVIDSVKDLDNVLVPLPIGVTRKGDTYYYFIERELGDSLDEKISSGDSSLDDFYNIANALGAIHARVSTKNREERNVLRSVESRLFQCGFHRMFVGNVVYGLSSLMGSFEGIVRVYNKDAHPRNWKLGEKGEVIVIDNEFGRIIPITFDDAALLDQHPALTYDDKLKIARRHWACFNRYSGREIIQDAENYELAYLNSVIIRAFEIYKQVAEIGRHDIKYSSIANARSAIRIVKDKFSFYYFDNSGSYNTLYKALGELQRVA